MKVMCYKYSANVIPSDIVETLSLKQEATYGCLLWLIIIIVLVGASLVQ